MQTHRKQRTPGNHPRMVKPRQIRNGHAIEWLTILKLPSPKCSHTGYGCAEVQSCRRWEQVISCHKVSGREKRGAHAECTTCRWVGSSLTGISIEESPMAQSNSHSNEENKDVIRGTTHGEVELRGLGRGRHRREAEGEAGDRSFQSHIL